MESSTQSQAPNCPNCGSPMQLLPAIDGNGFVAVCPTCPDQVALPQGKTTAPPAASSRFRQLIEATQQAAGTALPDKLLEDLPEEARRLLASKAPETPAGQISSSLAESLRRQGFVIDQDARGARITGAPRSTLPDTGKLSATDVIRLAADLEGGVLPPERRRTCPKCQAVIPRDSARCSWCGADLANEPPAVADPKS
jgi:hypothetical protein